MSNETAALLKSLKLHGMAQAWPELVAQARHNDFDPERFIAASPRTEDAYASFIGGQIGKSNVVLLVAERDGVVLGYAYAGVEGPDYMSLRGPAGVLYDIVVDPTHRGHGVGRLLLKPYWRRSRRAARLGSWCRRRRGTKPRNGSSLAQGFGVR